MALSIYIPLGYQTHPSEDPKSIRPSNVTMNVRVSRTSLFYHLMALSQSFCTGYHAPRWYEAYLPLGGLDDPSTTPQIMTVSDLRIVFVTNYPEASGVVYIRHLHSTPTCKISVSSTPFLSQTLHHNLLQDQSSTMQFTKIAIFLFAAMGAVANPIAAESGDLDVRDVQLSKYGGVSFSYEM